MHARTRFERTFACIGRRSLLYVNTLTPRGLPSIDWRSAYSQEQAVAVLVVALVCLMRGHINTDTHMDRMRRGVGTRDCWFVHSRAQRCVYVCVRVCIDGARLCPCADVPRQRRMLSWAQASVPQCAPVLVAGPKGLIYRPCAKSGYRPSSQSG